MDEQNLSDDNIATRNALRDALKECRGAFVTVAVFSFVVNLFILVLPIYMFSVFTRVLSSFNMATLAALFMMAMFALFIQAIVDMARSYVFINVGTFIDRRLGSRVLYASLTSALTRGKIKSIDAVRQVTLFRSLLTSPAMFNMLDVPWIPIFMAILFILNFNVGLIATFGALVLVLLALASDWTTKSAMLQANKTIARSTKDVSAAVRNSDVVQSMGLTPVIVDRWHHDNEETIEFQNKASRRAAIFAALTKFFRMGVQMGVMTAAAMEIMAPGSTLGPGSMMASVIIVGRALMPLEAAVGNYQSIFQMRDAYKSINEALDEMVDRPRSTVVPDDPKGALEIENVTYSVPGMERPILSNVNFRVEPGEVIGVVGPSAAGKTTLANLMVGLLKPTTGTARLSGFDVFAWPSEHLGRHIGYLPQNVELLSGTVRDNISRLDPHATAESIMAAAEKAGLAPVIQNLPEEFDTDVGDQGSLLSGGQRQRVALARAMYKDPHLLILDEPNAHLDRDGDEALKNAILNAKARNAMVLVIAHRPNVLQFVDKVLILSNGSVQKFTDRENVIVPVRDDQRKRVTNQATETSKQAADDKTPASSEETA